MRASKQANKQIVVLYKVPHEYPCTVNGQHHGRVEWVICAKAKESTVQYRQDGEAESWVGVQEREEELTDAII